MNVPMVRTMLGKVAQSISPSRTRYTICIMNCAPSSMCAVKRPCLAASNASLSDESSAPSLDGFQGKSATSSMSVSMRHLNTKYAAGCRVRRSVLISHWSSISKIHSALYSIMHSRKSSAT